MRRRRLALLLSLFLLASSASATPLEVTVAQLFAKPRQFDGRRVAVTGYYYADSETSSLYVSAAAKKSLNEPSIWVQFRGTPDVTSIAGRYARLVGTFHHKPTADPKRMNGYGTWGLSSAALLDTTPFRALR